MIPPLQIYLVFSRAHSQRCSRLDRCKPRRPPWRSLQSNVLEGNWQRRHPIPCPCGATFRCSVVRKPSSDNSANNSRVSPAAGDSCAQSLRHSLRPDWKRAEAFLMRRQRAAALLKTRTVNEQAFRSPTMKSVWLRVGESLLTVWLLIDKDDTLSWQRRNNFVSEPPQ